MEVVGHKSANITTAVKAAIQEAAGKKLISKFSEVYAGIVRYYLKFQVLLEVIKENQDKNWQENFQIALNKIRKVDKMSDAEEAV